MKLLRDIIDNIKSDDSIEVMRMLCEQIEEEESEHNVHLPLPKGPNLFLVLEVPGRTQAEIAYLALERESEDTWLNVFITTTKREHDSENISFKRKQVWQINDSRPQAIVVEFAKRYKFLKGN